MLKGAKGIHFPACLIHELSYRKSEALSPKLDPPSGQSSENLPWVLSHPVSGLGASAEATSVTGHLCYQ